MIKNQPIFTELQVIFLKEQIYPFFSSQIKFTAVHQAGLEGNAQLTLCVTHVLTSSSNLLLGASQTFRRVTQHVMKTGDYLCRKKQSLG